MTDSQKWLVLAAVGLTGWLIYLLAPILTPFAVGALLAYLGDPMADRLEARGLSRTSSVVVVFSAMTLGLVLILLLLVPKLEYQISKLISNLPAYVTWVRETVAPWLQQHFGIEPDLLDVDQLIKTLKSHWQQAGGIAAAVVGSVSRSGLVVIEWLMNLILIPVVAFYLLRDWDILVAKVRDLMPRRLVSTVGKLAVESDEVLGAFLRGQFSVMVALGAIYSIGLWIVGLDLALLIGMLAGLISFIPYLGSIVGVVAACVAALVQFQDLLYLVPVGIVFAVGQTLEGTLLTPWLVGDKIGLHPVAVIFAVLAGGQLFGFLGILLALPVASVVMVLLRHVHDLYKDSDFYSLDQQAGAAEESPPSADSTAKE